MPRLLVVEDDVTIRDLLRRRLQQAGFDVVTADDGEQGLESVREHRPDLVLMDLGLPGKDGWEIARLLKADPATKATPIIAVSAHAMVGDQEKARQAGCDDYETKPVHMPRLLQKIGTLLQAAGVALPQPKKPPTKPPRLPPTKVLPSLAATLTGDKDTCPVVRKRILVVEDNDANREMLRRRLEKQGYSAVGVPGGREALDLIRREPIDLVLLDIMMPEMDGYQVLEFLKSDPELKELPVLMISALDTMDSVVRCIELGAEDYLQKPYDPVLLQARVSACLDKKRLRDQELAYLRAVADLTEAAAAVEKGAFDAARLEPVASRSDELGRLARVFQRMAHEVIAREQQLRQEVQQLRVEIDDKRKHEQVAEITDNAYFQSLQQKALQLRRRASKAGQPTSGQS